MAARPISPRHLQILRHTLGLNHSSIPYRNHFATHPDGDDYTDISALVAAGLMGLTQIDETGSYGNMHFYHVTDEGRHIAMTVRPPGQSRSRLKARARWSMFCRVHEVVPDLTFRDWLVLPEWAESRESL